MTLVWFILILSLIVGIHEFGHFIFAKLSNTYVYEFSIGMGKKLFGHKRKGGEMSNLKNLVPTLELCKQIPAGEFEDAALVWVYDDAP